MSESRENDQRTPAEPSRSGWQVLMALVGASRLALEVARAVWAWWNSNGSGGGSL